MADYSTAASTILSSLETSSEGLVEEYEIKTNGRRIKRGKAKDQIEAAVLLEGLAARRSGGLFRLSKMRNPRS